MEDLKIKVGPIGLLDMLKFKNQVKTRDKEIAKGKADLFPKEFDVNQKAKLMHPKSQSLIVCDIIKHSDDVKTFVFEAANGQPLAYFRAGQYLSFRLEIGGSVVTRPISICSSPKEALKGNYAITVKRAGFASDYMLDHWKIGEKVEASAPLGNFYYTGLRDGKHVIGLAGGSGITPFVSMALAIAEGTEDFELTLLYGSRTREDIVLRDVLKECEKRANGKIKIVYVLSDEEIDGYEYGFITKELIQKYKKEGTNSYFVCGPQAMYQFVSKEMSALHIQPKWIRRELFGASKTPWKLEGYPEKAKDKTYKVTVVCCGDSRTIRANANESIQIALERAGIKAPSHCRSGECGWCRSRLIDGNVFVPNDVHGIRAADKLYGYIHPCVSYPISDIILEINKE